MLIIIFRFVVGNIGLLG